MNEVVVNPPVDGPSKFTSSSWRGELIRHQHQQDVERVFAADKDLAKAYISNVHVRACLWPWVHGSMGLEICMRNAVIALADLNASLLKQTVEAYERQRVVYLAAPNP